MKDRETQIGMPLFGEVASAPRASHSDPVRAALHQRFVGRLQVNPQLSRKKEGWDRFAQELFHHKLRLLPWKS